MPKSEFKELKHLQSLTEEEKNSLKYLIDKEYSSTKARVLKNKLDSLYDFQKLGLRALRAPKLTLLDNLEAARTKRCCVRLINYRSTNSNEVRDRIVEPFDVDPELDTLQAYDYDRKKQRHFVLSRIERVEVLVDKPWVFDYLHHKLSTDVFRIAQDQQQRVHLRLDVYAFNNLIERFPQAQSHLQPDAEINFYDFDCPVNSNFYGLLDFILGNVGHIKIYHPEALREAVRAKAKTLIESLEDPFLEGQ